MTHAAVLFAHHTGKQAARDGIADAYAGRGGSALADGCRSVLRLTTLTDQQVSACGIDRRAVPGDILQLVHAKASYSRRSEVTWLLRGPEGVLEQFSPQLQDGEANLRAVYRWVKRDNRCVFSRKDVVTTYRQAVIGGTEKAAKVWFDAAVSRGELTRSEKKWRGGGDRYLVAKHMADRFDAEAAQAETEFSTSSHESERV